MGLFKNWLNSKSNRTDDSKSETSEEVNRNVDAKEEKKHITPNSLPEAILMIAEERGKDFLCGRSFINMLNDYRLLKDIPALKNVLVSMQSDGYIQKLINTNSWELESANVRTQFVRNYGIREDIVEYAIRSFGYGLHFLHDLPIYTESIIPLQQVTASNQDELSVEVQSKGGQSMRLSQQSMAVYDPHEPYINYKYPGLDLLNPSSDRMADEGKAEQSCNKVIEVLHSLGFELTDITVHVGPSVDFYEITPDPKAKISRLRGVEDNLSMAMSSKNVRLLLPIPDSSNIGIEIPALSPQKLALRNVFESEDFRTSTMQLPMAFGYDMRRKVFMLDLTTLPNLLIAGATGQGKTNCINDIVMSLLYKKHPNELKMILTDFKKVEFSIYNEPVQFLAIEKECGIDYVVSNGDQAQKTFAALKEEFDGRYNLLAKARCRNINEYNERFVSRRLNPSAGHEYLPYIVVVIDEYNDLVSCNRSFFETIILELVQKGRNVGIHFVISTNRPTADMFSSSIKTEFTSRIAFKVSKGSESRIILDVNGAEKLLGDGDMLYMDKKKELHRVQCAYVDYEEMDRVCWSIRVEEGPVSPYELHNHLVHTTSPVDLDHPDPVLEEVARLVVSTQQGSTSLIQRKFVIGYNRASRLMDQLQALGVVGTAKGAKPRQVLVSDENTLNVLLARIR